MNSHSQSFRKEKSDARKSHSSARLFAFAAVAACLAFGAAPAHADIITSLVGSAASDGTGGWLYTYTASLAGAQNASPVGDANGVGMATFGTVYDFGAIKSPITSTGLLSTDFVFTTSLTSTPAVGTLPTDDPSLLNIRFTDTLVNIPANTFLGTFTANSSQGPNTILANFDGQADKDVPGNQADGTPTGNIGLLSVPTTTPVPEPVSLSLLGIGLLGIAQIRRRKIHTTKAAV